MPILPADRDPRLITVRRGGTLTDEDHRLLGEWAALCAEHVLPLFEHVAPNDTRPRDAIAVAHVAARALGAAAYAIRATAGASSSGEAEPARVDERDWQRERIPPQIRELVVDDQRRRSAIRWNVSDDRMIEVRPFL